MKFPNNQYKHYVGKKISKGEKKMRKRMKRMERKEEKGEKEEGTSRSKSTRTQEGSRYWRQVLILIHINGPIWN